MNVPPGWLEVELRDVIAEGPSNGFSPPTDPGAEGTLTLKLSATTTGRFILTDRTTKRIQSTLPANSKYWLRPGDILVQRANTLEYVGATALFSGPPDTYIYPDLMMRIRASERADPVYLAAYLNAPETRDQLRKKATGTAGNMPKINGETLRSTRVLLPPLNEQRRIVAKLEALQSRSRRAREALDAVPPLLEKLRQSILAAAFRGNLTKDWRAKHKDVEPATELLKRIRIERRKKWEEAELTKMTAKGKRPTDDKWKAKYKEPEPVDITRLPKLPAGWCWASLDELTFIVGGVTKGQRRKGTETLRDVAYLRVANVQRGHLNLDEVKTIEVTEEEVTELRLHPGDVLLNEGGDRDKLGRGWVWDGQLAECVHQNHVFRARPVLSEIQPKYISHYANHLGQTFFVDQGKQTTNLASVSISRVRRFPVALPPASEQAALVELLDDRLARASSLEVAMGGVANQMVTLDRAILSKAFSGSLVPHGPDDAAAEAPLDAPERASVPGANETDHKTLRSTMRMEVRQ